MINDFVVDIVVDPLKIAAKLRLKDLSKNVHARITRIKAAKTAIPH